ncbi:flagellar hook-basal body protein [Salirhabdus sp. Marseille-P4669]|uniref:flagellar hook-basal body protein n=1 Tax=Salirhabdus sp. Marseille-P4669 TaxID=2042310 RepID=UPI000C79CF5D|nr:flagellar hook-basal body protein [Salirhabdus sp. Marseille-P4669]
MRNASIAAVTMGQLQKRLDLIGNNIANANTAGYKAKTANFSSLLVQQIDNLSPDEDTAPRVTPAGFRQGNGARLAHANVNMASGNLMTTERALDVALTNEKQFFQVQVTENGVTETQFTRAGNFYLQPINNNEQVMLVTAEGHPIVGNNGPIVVQGGFDDIRINENGEIAVTRGTAVNAEASLELVQVELPRSLESAGGNRYRFPNEAYGMDENAVAQVVDASVLPGTLETSNVNLSEALTSMMETQRAYQLNARAITFSDQMAGLVNSLR